MRCSLPPHKEGLPFRSYEEFEAHYNKSHVNRCVECRKNFPSEHLLGVHIEECHDALAAVQRERGEHTYSCFVEGCERRCLTPQKRRMHLIDKHMYPRNYFFAVTKEGTDGRRSLLLEGGHRRRRSSGAAYASPKQSRRRASTLERGAAGQSNRGGEAQAEAPAKDKSTEESKTSSADQPADTEMDGLAGALSALQFVPQSIRFGRRGGRAGFAKS